MSFITDSKGNKGHDLSGDGKLQPWEIDIKAGGKELASGYDSSGRLRQDDWSKSQTLGDMLENINNGRVSDISVISQTNVKLPQDIVLNKDNQATAVKGATAVPGQTATAVPGQKKPPSAGGAAGVKNAPNPKSGSGGAGAQVDANKDGKDDKTGKPISQTAQNVGAKTGVQTAKIGGQKMDLNDPKMANMRAAIDKALGKGTTASIDKLDPPSKEKLKKALA